MPSCTRPRLLPSPTSRTTLRGNFRKIRKLYKEYIVEKKAKEGAFESFLRDCDKLTLKALKVAELMSAEMERNACVKELNEGIKKSTKKRR
jgi:hypothetical protein